MAMFNSYVSLPEGNHVLHIGRQLNHQPLGYRFVNVESAA